MNHFDKVIGYDNIKRELIQICDTLKNHEHYESFGVSTPHGLLLYGVPGVGKSLMASALIKESGLPVVTCRRKKGGSSFVDDIRGAFEKAVENAPAIVFLDDLDKFACTSPDDDEPSSAAEYVAVQSCIDEVKEKNVFVLATANKIKILPDSLRRMGRFDRRIEVGPPDGEDAVRIIRHYLSERKNVRDADPVLIARFLQGSSCAELETILNEAGRIAVYERADCITMDHILSAFLKSEYGVAPVLPRFAAGTKGVSADSPFPVSLDDPALSLAQVVCHEAGHAAVSEILCPGSVVLVSACGEERSRGGFVKCYNDETRPLIEWERSRIAVALGGKAAVEVKYGMPDLGASVDLDRAFNLTRHLITDEGVSDLRYYSYGFVDTDFLQHDAEKAVADAVEGYYRRTKALLSANEDFFEKIAGALAEKGLLTGKDISVIRESCCIIREAA